jgi:hypothetical protein
MKTLELITLVDYPRPGEPQDRWLRSAKSCQGPFVGVLSLFIIDGQCDITVGHC